MSTRATILNLLFAFALAWSGSAAQFHSFAHAQYDLATASQGASQGKGKAPAPLKHSTEQCLVVHALDGTAAQAGGLLASESISQVVVSPVTEPGGESPAAAFQSRAPPFLV